MEHFEIKDTKGLQMKSLKEFAWALGNYWMHISDGNYFASASSIDKPIISFRTMVSLHNDGNYDNHGRVYERMGFDLYSWEKAKGAKIVERVSLIANKKKKSIHCNKHLVKFVKPFYQDMFLDK